MPIKAFPGMAIKQIGSGVYVSRTMRVSDSPLISDLRRRCCRKAGTERSTTYTDYTEKESLQLARRCGLLTIREIHHLVVWP